MVRYKRRCELLLIESKSFGLREQVERVLSDRKGLLQTGRTPLHEGCYNGAPLDVMKLLIDKGANITLTDSVSVV